jgi:hypothetical protein
MFADPFVLPVNGTNVNLARIVSGNLTSAYRAADGLTLFDIAHKISRGAAASRVNSSIHTEWRKPKEENPSDYHSLHIRTVIDRPEVPSLGWTESELILLCAAHAAILNTSSYITKLYGLQS